MTKFIENFVSRFRSYITKVDYRFFSLIILQVSVLIAIIIENQPDDHISFESSCIELFWKTQRESRDRIKRIKSYFLLLYKSIRLQTMLPVLLLPNRNAFINTLLFRYSSEETIIASMFISIDNGFLLMCLR